MKKEEVNGNEDKNIEKLPLGVYKPQLIVDAVRQQSIKLIRNKRSNFFGVSVAVRHHQKLFKIKAIIEI
ncbi:hypothetical protein [Okeania sp. KiyG1]|uniref:hypothetical protein n=1 Tax=Okeania sp. KiyG1 TaxID=2720165 RepID=UPI0019244C20|nr:hypothetical protein [Okeania sp. KiyG1]